MKLWVSGLPTEDTHRAKGFQPVKGSEVRDVLNQALKDHAPHIQGEVIEVDRKDERKPYSFALLSDETAARELCTLSRHRKVLLRGERLILDLSNYNTSRVEAIHTGPNRNNSQWHEERGERFERRGRKGESKGESSGGWQPRDRGNKGGGWKGSSR